MEGTTQEYADNPLGFGLELFGGRGVLCAKDQQIGPLDLKLLELEIPELEFPFDISGGPDAFKSRRCVLRHLTLGLSAESLSEALNTNHLREQGFSNLRLGFREGFLEIAGSMAYQSRQADFSARVSFILRDAHLLHIVFHDIRVYGPFGLPACMIPVYLRRGLGFPYLHGETCASWEFQPTGEFLRTVLPRMGWKVPDYREASIITAAVGQDQLLLVCGDNPLSDSPELVVSETSLKGTYAAEAMGIFREAEQALSGGEIDIAYEAYQRFLGSDQAGPWVKNRLLQLGSAIESCHSDALELANACLAEDPKNPQALLALGNIAQWKGNHEEAAEYYSRLSSEANQNRNRFNRIHADLAAGLACEGFDPAQAITHYENAASRDKNSVTAYKGIFRLRCQSEEWVGAKRAGERLVRLELSPNSKARIWCELSAIYGEHFKDFKAARQGYERALREEEDYELALEGLAQTFIARGEPARAITFLTRLLEKARSERRAPRVVELGVRLGLLWENELGDLDAAIEHYQLVIAIDRRNRAARLNLADIYLKRSQFRHARALFDDLISITQEDERLEILPDYIAANMGLAALIDSTDGANWEVFECLDRVLDRAPHHEAALEMIAPLLRASEKWGRLADVLMAMAQGERTPDETIPFLLECAELYRTRIERPDDARIAYGKALDLRPADPTALEGLRSLLDNDEQRNSFCVRLEKAGDSEEDLEQIAVLLSELARLRLKLGHPVDSAIEAYKAALDAWPSLEVSARELCGLYERVIDPNGHANALLRLYQATTDEVEKADALIKRGKLLWPKLDQPDAAAESFREALDIDSMLLDAWLSLAEILENTGAVKRAVTVLESSVKALKDHSEDCMVIYERLARLARTLDSPDLECQYLEKSIELGGPEDIICERFLKVLEKLDRHQDAADYMTSWARRGNILDSSNLFLGAIRIFHSINDSVQSVGLCMELIEAGEEKVRDLDDNSETVRCALEAARLLEKIYRDVVHPEGVVRAIRHQLALAPTEYTGTLERLILAQIAGDDLEGAEVSARTLLKHSPESRLVHGFLARQSDHRGEYLRALNYWECFLTSSEPIRELHEDLVRAYERAASLAHEVAPPLLETLYRLFSIDFREGEESYTILNVPPLGEILLEHDQFEEFIRLRKWQLDNEIQGDDFERKWDIASVYHRNLGSADEAISLYREVSEHPDYSNTYVQDAYESLIELFQERKEWRELSQILLELAERAVSPHESLQLGLRAADVLAREMGDRAAARFVFHELMKRHTNSDEVNSILDALRGYEFDEEAAKMLARSLEANWNVEDGRFAELLRLYNTSLERPEAAIALAKRAIEIDPELELVWWTLISLCEENPTLGEVNAVLESWINSSQGAKRLSLLTELYGRIEDANPEPRSEEVTAQLVELLSQIIALEENPLDSLEKLASLYEHAGDTTKYLVVLERIVVSLEPGDIRDSALNRVFALADGPLNDDSIKISALERLSTPTPKQWERLAGLLFETEEYGRLLDYREQTSYFATDTCLDLAKHWLEDFELDHARFYFDHFLDKGGNPDIVWSLAAEVWPSADRLEELGRWRIQWADRESGVKPNATRILGACQIIDAIRSKDSTPSTMETVKAELISKMGIERDFAAVNFEDVDEAWAAYICALICEFPDWIERSSEALELLLGDDDLRLGEVLVNRYQRKLEVDDYSGAVDVAKRLVDLRHPQGWTFWEQALEKGNLEDELLVLLESRAERGGHEGPGLWVRVAKIYHNRKDWKAAARSLRLVEEESRDGSWAALAYEHGGQANDFGLQAAGARVRVKFCQDHEKKAEWIRRWARILWWKLDERNKAFDLLFEAHQLAAEPISLFLERSEEAFSNEGIDSAVCWLKEGILLYDDESGLELRISLVDHLLSLTRNEEAREQLDALLNFVFDDSGEWEWIAQVAAKLGDEDLQLRATENGYGRNRELFETYRDLLAEAGDWNKLVAVLVERAEELSDDMDNVSASACLDEAGVISRKHLNDSIRALNYWQEAARMNPDEDRLFRTLELALAVRDPSSTASVAETILETLSEDSEDRVHVLRVLLGARDSLGLDAEALTLLKQLVTTDKASFEEKRRLAHKLHGSDMPLAASLFEELATSDEGEDSRAEHWFKAAQNRYNIQENESAASALENALKHGYDSLSAFAMGLELLEGKKRGNIIEGFLRHGGDGDWEIAKRSEIRRELAELYFAENDFDAIWHTLRELEDLEVNSETIALKERLLEAQGKTHELALLWLEEGLSERSGWEDEESFKRLNNASDYFLSIENDELELRALKRFLPALKVEDDKHERLIELCAAAQDREEFDAAVGRGTEYQPNSEAGDTRAVRYADLSFEYFGDLEASISLLEEQFHLRPSVNLAKELEQYYNEGKRPSDAYRIYQELLSENKDNDTARGFCLKYSSQEQLWGDWLHFAELHLEFVSDSEIRHKWLKKMASCQLDQFQDQGAAIDLLMRALEWKEAPPETSHELYELLLEIGDYTSVASLLQENYFPKMNAEKYVVQLSEIFRAEGHDQERDELFEWLSSILPDCEATVNHALAQARISGDSEAILESLRRKNELYPPADKEELALLQSEAAWAAVDAEDDSSALFFFRAVVSGGEVTPDILFSAYQAAKRIDNQEALSELLDLSRAHVETLELWAPNVIREERYGVSEFISSIWMDGGNAPAAIRSRLLHLQDLKLDSQKEILLHSLEQLGDDAAATNAELKLLLYDELIRVARTQGDAKELLRYRLQQVLWGSGTLEDLFEVYSLSAELGNTETQRILLERAGKRLIDLPAFVQEAPAGERVAVLEFARCIYETSGQVESAIRITMDLWEVETPANFKQAIENCLVELEKAKISPRSSLVIELRNRMVAIAYEANDPSLELEYSLSLLEAGQNEPDFALKLFLLASLLEDQTAQGRVISANASVAHRFADWAKGLEEGEQRVDAFEFLYELYLHTGATEEAMEARLLLAESLPSTQARAVLDGCLKDLALKEGEASPTIQARVLYREGLLAQELGDKAGAVLSWQKARELTPDDLEITASLRVCFEEEEKWSEVESLRLQELSAAPNLEVQYDHLKALADIYQNKLNSPAKGIEMLEQAVSCRLDDAESLKILVAHYESIERWDKFLGRFEQLAPYINVEELSPETVENLARSYDTVAGNPEKAKQYYERVLEERPDDVDVITILRRLSEAVGDYSTYAMMELELLQRDEDLEERIRRTFVLMGVLRDKVQDSEGTVALAQEIEELVHGNRVLIRTLADEYAADSDTYIIARDMYTALHHEIPFDTHILRILARLSGQLGDSERAYGFYAGLLALVPSDEEANRYVTACRQIRPRLPRRSIADDDRALLRDSDLVDEIENLYLPLAQYAEQIEPASLARRGIAERDRLQPTDPQSQLLIQVLEPLGVEHSSLFHWRGGGFECDAELIGAPTFLVGSNVLTGASEREQMFLVARTAELYRSGHTFCGRMEPNALQEVLSALALAIDPTLSVPGDPDNIRRMVTRIEGSLTHSFKHSMKAKAAIYAGQVGYSNVIAWKEAALATACRTALLLTCDLSEAIETLFRFYDRDVDTYEQRIEVVGEIPELLDLMRFGTSETYFQLRRRMGLSLDSE